MRPESQDLRKIEIDYVEVHFSTRIQIEADSAWYIRFKFER
jgi:hypothetical protein